MIKYSEDGKVLLKCSKAIKGEVSILPGVEIIATNAFKNCEYLESVIIPDSVIEIKKQAFLNCITLKRIKISQQLKIIGDLAFSNTALKSLRLPKTVSKIGYAICKDCKGLKVVKNKRFLVHYSPEIGCEFVRYPRKRKPVVVDKKVEELPNGYEEICSGACVDLSFDRIVIPEGVKIIHTRAFDECVASSIFFPSTLETIKRDAIDVGHVYIENIPDKIRSIGVNGFEGIYSGDENLQNETVILHIPTETNGEFNVDKKIKIIGNHAFEDSNISSVRIPNSVTAIFKGAFENCKKLKDVQLSHKLKRISNQMFSGCEKLEFLKIPEGVEIIEDRAFEGCTSLKEIELPSSIKEIGEAAFCDCINLTKIILCDKIQKIGVGAFYGCWNLKRIQLPRSLTTLEETVFCDCKSLEYIDIPNSVKKVGYNCFLGCKNWRNRYMYERLLRDYEEYD